MPIVRVPHSGRTQLGNPVFCAELSGPSELSVSGPTRRKAELE